MGNNVEILSPAGNMKSFIAALNAGADAIYMGGPKHNAREMAENFSIEQYINCIYEAHKRDVKVYLTLNTLIKDDEIKEALELVATLYSKGLDAVILQDLGLALKIHELFPDLNMHASTQMSVYSKEQVKFLEKLGFSRVVLARELNVDEIEKICKGTTVEIEVFVHGALCVGFSGQCNMSKLIGDRSANRGTCAQTCRMKYSLYKEGEKIPVVQNKYILSKKDIWGLEYVKRLIDIGVKSLKIEGRNKFPEYVALATSVYKKAVLNETEFEQKNNIEFEKNKKELLQLFNRSGKSDGYFTGVKFKDSITQKTPKNVGLKLGVILEVNKKYIKVKLEQQIDLHDGIEIYSNDQCISTIVTCIRDNNFKLVNEKIETGNVVWLGDINSKCKVGDIIYKTSDSKLMESINREYVLKITRQKEYDIFLSIKKGSKIAIKVKNNDKEINYASDIMPEKSITKSLSYEDVNKAFSKTDSTSVKFKTITCNIDDGIFLKVSELNELRRCIIEQIETKFLVNKDISNELDKINEIKFENIDTSKKGKSCSLYIYSYDKTRNYKEEYNLKYNEKLQRLYILANDYALYYKDIFEKYSDIELFFVIPNVTLDRLHSYIEKNLEQMVKLGVNGVLVGNLGFMELLLRLKQEYGIILGADYSLNITNALTVNCLNNFGFDFVTLSFELNNDEVIDLIKLNKNIELVENLATAMTSRYCLIGSFVGTTENNSCNRACTKAKYYILDAFNKRYDIVCDNFDCVMRLVRNKDRYSEEIRKQVSLRHVWL